MNHAAFRHLLVPVDDSECSIAAIHYALRLAGPAARVTFANAINLGAAVDGAVTPAGGDPTIVLDALEAERRHVYAVAAAFARIAGIEAETIDLSGPIVDAIVALAPRIGAQATVMGTHGRRGLARAVIGSVATGVLRRASVPTFVVHAESAVDPESIEPIRRIVVDIDGNGRMTAQIALVMDLAEVHRAQIFFVHLAGEFEESIVDRRHALRVATDRGIDYDVVRGTGNVSEAVLNVATAIGADLIAVGSHAHDAGRLFRSSICEKIVCASPIPVVVANDARVSHTAGLRRPA